VGETPARGDDTAQVTPAIAAGATGGDTCPTCGGAPGPGQDRLLFGVYIEEKGARLWPELGDEWSLRHRDEEGD